VKLDAWHALALPLLVQAFPEVPWLFLYRDPVDVMQSQARMPGIHTVPGVLPSEVVGIEGGEHMSQTEYCARVLARICDAVVAHWPVGRGLLLNYSELRSGIPARVLCHFALEVTPTEAAAMHSAAARDSKTGEPFVDDDVRKRAPSAAICEAVDEHLRGPFGRLENLRRASTRSTQAQ
jgi:hypothetical protein